MKAGRDRPLAGACILIVEDDAILLMDLEGILSDAGADVVSCYSVVTALRALEAQRFDAALLDLRIARESATVVAQQLVERHTPFVFYTGQLTSDPLLAHWRDVQVLQKPAHPRRIVAAVVSALGH